MTGPGASRWARAWTVLPYLFVLLPAAFVLARGWRPEAAALAAGAGAWQWLMVTSRPARIERPAAVIVYFAVMLALVGALIRIDTLFTVTALVMFIQSFALIPGRWAYAGVAATAAVLVAARPESGRAPDEILFSFLVATLVASATGLATQAVRDQNENRRVMIERLRENGARLAALAEENADLQARLLTQAREAGVLGERQRMAREIHDTVAQGLTAILTQLEAADTVAGDLPAVRSRLDTVRATARESLAEARRSVQALRPAPLDEAQLATALRGVAAAWSRTTGVPASVAVTGTPVPLHAEVEITLLRVAQEALANTARYAAAARVGLTLSYMEDVVALDVRDDGSGFTLGAPGSPDGGGFGLVAMRQRVTRLAGDLVIETAPGQGTGISATVPAIPAAPAAPVAPAAPAVPAAPDVPSAPAAPDPRPSGLPGSAV